MVDKSRQLAPYPGTFLQVKCIKCSSTNVTESDGVFVCGNCGRVFTAKIIRATIAGCMQ